MRGLKEKLLGSWIHRNSEIKLPCCSIYSLIFFTLLAARDWNLMQKHLPLTWIMAQVTQSNLLRFVGDLFNKYQSVYSSTNFRCFWQQDMKACGYTLSCFLYRKLYVHQLYKVYQIHKQGAFGESAISDTPGVWDVSSASGVRVELRWLCELK